MNYENYRIGADGLYQSSKEAKEGFEMKTYGTENKVTYVKKIRQIEGTITGVEVKEFTHDNKTIKNIELKIQDGDTLHQVSTALKNQKGNNYSEATTAILSALNGYKLGERVSFSAYYKKSTGSNGKEYNNLNVYINHVNIIGSNGKPEGTGFIPYTDLPKAISKEVAGETQWNFEAVMEFWYAKLQEISKRFENSPTPTSTPPAQDTKPAMQPNTSFETAGSSPTEDIDDLPF